MPPATEPDRATLLQFVLGTLPDEQLTAVKQWLDADPRAAEKLAELQTRDPVTEVLDARALAETSDAQLAKTLPQAVPPVVPAALPEFVGGYQIVRELGRGGMGVVYEARDPNLPRRVAVKVIADDAGDAARTADARARFRKEAAAVSLIDHPNVVPVYAFGEDAGRPFLVMPLLAGETLAERLKRGPLSAAELVRVGREVATALEAAHAAGVIHRDIKPGNVWLDAGTGRARVLDFGLAKSQEAPAHTETGAIVGSAHYMSPQQAKGEALDARTDLFSLGALLYHAATGRRPFDGETVYAVLRAVVEVTPADPAGVPPRVAKLIRKLLEKEPAARPASASEVLLELADPVPAPPVPPKRRFPVWALAAGLLLALAAGAIVYEVKFSTGTLVVDATPEADVRLKNGTIEVYGEDGKLKYTIAPGARAANVAAGTYKLKVMGADGVELDTEEFTMKRNGKAIVRVSAKPVPPPVVSKDADRRAAEWVLSAGGTVAIWEGNEHRWIDTVAALPREPFALHAVSFGKHVTHVTDEDLTAFNGCERLRQLDLRDTRATDAGLLHFARCKGLQLLYLKGKGITDKGLAQLPDQPELTQLSLVDTGVTDAGLTRFAKCKHLGELGLSDTAVTDAGIAHFQKSVELHSVVLARTAVTDACIAHLSACRDILVFKLQGTKVTDAGLKSFHSATAPRELDVRNTQVTAAGVTAFAKAHPHCRIVWDGGTITPASAPDRRAAEWVLSVGGTLEVTANGARGPVASKEQLPAGPLQLVSVTLSRNGKATDAGLAAFAGCKHVRELYIDHTSLGSGLEHFRDCTELEVLAAQRSGVRDEHLAHLKNCTKLKVVSFATCRGVTDLGLAHLAGAKKLVDLNLSETGVTDAGLARFAECPDLAFLGLARTIVTDKGLEPFRDHTGFELLLFEGLSLSDAVLEWVAKNKKLNYLNLNASRVTDAGLARLHGLKLLTELHLGKAPVTATGVAALAKALPNCKIVWDGGTIEPGSERFTGAFGRAEFPTYTRVAQIGTHERRHRANINGMDVAVRWGRAATVAADGLKVWETATLKLVAEVPRRDENAPVWGSCAIIGENHVAVCTFGGGKDQGLTVFDISQTPPRVVRRLPAAPPHMCDIAVSGGREWVAFARDGNVELWKVAALLQGGTAAHTIKDGPDDRERSYLYSGMKFANEQSFAFKTETGIRRFAYDKNGWDERPAVPTSGLCVSFAFDNRDRLLVGSQPEAGKPFRIEEWNLSGAKPQVEGAVDAPTQHAFRVQLDKGSHLLAEAGIYSFTLQLPLKADTKPVPFPYLRDHSGTGTELRHVGLDAFVARDGSRLRHLKLKDGLLIDSFRGDANDGASVGGWAAALPTVAANRVAFASTGSGTPVRVWDFSGTKPELKFEDRAPATFIDHVVLSERGTKALVARLDQPPELISLGKTGGAVGRFGAKAKGHIPLGLTKEAGGFALTYTPDALHVWNCDARDEPILSTKFPTGATVEPRATYTLNGWVVFVPCPGPNKEPGFLPIRIDTADNKATARVGAHLRSDVRPSANQVTALTLWNVPNEPESWRLQFTSLSSQAAPREVKLPLALRQRFPAFHGTALDPHGVGTRATVWSNSCEVGYVAIIEGNRVVWEHKFGGEVVHVGYAGPNQLMVLLRNGVVEVLYPKYYTAPK